MSQTVWTPELGLIGALTGLFGVITAIIALLLKFLREKPKLEIDVSHCSYRLVKANATRRYTRLDLEFNVDNVGDRGTQLKNVVVSFRYRGKLYKDSSPVVMTLDRFVDAHRSKQMKCSFRFPELSIELPAPTIDCNFTLHHTHNKKKFSTKAPYPRSFSIPLSKEWKKPAN